MLDRSSSVIRGTRTSYENAVSMWMHVPAVWEHGALDCKLDVEGGRARVVDRRDLGSVLPEERHPDVCWPESVLEGEDLEEGVSSVSTSCQWPDLVVLVLWVFSGP